MPPVQLTVQGLQGEDGAVDGVDVEEALQVCVSVDGVSGEKKKRHKENTIVTFFLHESFNGVLLSSNVSGR